MIDYVLILILKMRGVDSVSSVALPGFSAESCLVAARQMKSDTDVRSATCVRRNSEPEQPKPYPYRKSP